MPAGGSDRRSPLEHSEQLNTADNCQSLHDTCLSGAEKLTSCPDLFPEGLKAPEKGWKAKIYKLELQMTSVVQRVVSGSDKKTSQEGNGRLVR